MVEEASPFVITRGVRGAVHPLAELANKLSVGALWYQLPTPYVLTQIPESVRSY